MKNLWTVFVDGKRTIAIYILFQTILFSQAKYLLEIQENDVLTSGLTNFGYKLFFNLQCLVEIFFTVIAAFFIAVLQIHLFAKRKGNIMLGLLVLTTFLLILFFSPSLLSLAKAFLGIS